MNFTNSFIIFNDQMHKKKDMVVKYVKKKLG